MVFLRGSDSVPVYYAQAESDNSFQVFMALYVVFTSIIHKGTVALHRV